MAKLLINGVADPAPMNLNSDYQLPTRAKVYLESATSEANCDILSDIREIVRSTVNRLSVKTQTQELNSKEADILLKITKVYQALDSSTEKEHAKYQMTDKSVEDLKAIAAGTGMKINSAQ